MSQRIVKLETQETRMVKILNVELQLLEAVLVCHRLVHQYQKILLARMGLVQLEMELIRLHLVGKRLSGTEKITFVQDLVGEGMLCSHV